MNEAPLIEAWIVLREFGFIIDPAVISDNKPGLSYDFGNFKLTAVWCINTQFANVVLFGGVLNSRNCLANVHFQMPERILSREQCAAWIVWHLDRDAGGSFEPARTVDWVPEGRKNLHLLPWIKRQEEFRTRPHCTVQRERL
jgi:hypothetical protein